MSLQAYEEIFTLIGNQKIFLSKTKMRHLYWVGETVHSCLSIRHYRKAQTNIWPTQYLFCCQNVESWINQVLKAVVGRMSHVTARHGGQSDLVMDSLQPAILLRIQTNRILNAVSKKTCLKTLISALTLEVI